MVALKQGSVPDVIANKLDHLLILTSGTEQYLITCTNKKYKFLLTTTLTISVNHRQYNRKLYSSKKSSLSTALSSYTYTIVSSTIFSALSLILFINPTHSIAFCIFNFSVTPCFSAICSTNIHTCSLAS